MVATSIKTLKDELEKHGHEVYILTTDPNATDFEEDVIRMPSVPFVSLKIAEWFAACGTPI